MRKLMMPAIVLLLVVATACSGDDGGDGTDPPATGGVTGADEPTGATGSTDGSGGEPAGPAPDACSLIAPEEIRAITRTDPGVGSTSGGPDRSICIYGSGLILAVEIAANYEASKAIIEDDRPIEPVSDLGNEAYWDTFGQIVALGDDFFVGVTVGATNDTARERAIRLAEVMLESL